MKLFLFFIISISVSIFAFAAFHWVKSNTWGILVPPYVPPASSEDGNSKIEPFTIPYNHSQWQHVAKDPHNPFQHFNWEAQVDFINNKVFRNAQFRVRIRGLNIHFVHHKQSNNAAAAPTVLLLHGWSGSFYEFSRIYSKLSVQYNIVIPSLPGYGYSDGDDGLDPYGIGVIFHELMTQRLGYTRYVVQGGDWGSVIAQAIASLYPQSVRGVHLNFFPSLTLSSVFHLVTGGIGLPQETQHRVVKSREFLLNGLAYFHFHATKPDVISSMLTSSPHALSIYLLDKYTSWSDCASMDMVCLNATIPFEHIATLYALYATNPHTIRSSINLYYTFMRSPNLLYILFSPVGAGVPVGLADFAGETFWTPVEDSAFGNIISVTTHSN
eukprot:PhF_6_TR22544/c0_g1_i2/m.32044/K01253/EPHX1; microsomal epoxide hydrolase